MKERKRDYSILEMRDESFICTESITRETHPESFGNRFRRFTIGGDAVAGHEAIRNLLTFAKGKVEVVVIEKTGVATVFKGSHSVTGLISTL